MRTSRSKRKRVLARARQMAELAHDSAGVRKVQAAWVRSWRAEIRQRAEQLDRAGVFTLLSDNMGDIGSSLRERLTRWAKRQLEAAHKRRIASCLRAVEDLMGHADYEGAAAFARQALQTLGTAQVQEHILDILPHYMRRQAQKSDAWLIAERLGRSLPQYADAVTNEAVKAIERLMQQRVRKCEC